MQNSRSSIKKVTISTVSAIETHCNRSRHLVNIFHTNLDPTGMRCVTSSKLHRRPDINTRQKSYITLCDSHRSILLPKTARLEMKLLIVIALLTTIQLRNLTCAANRGYAIGFRGECFRHDHCQRICWSRARFRGGSCRNRRCWCGGRMRRGFFGVDWP